MLTPFRKVILIFLLTLVATYISLPREIPINLNLGPVQIEKTFYRKDIEFSLGSFEVDKNFELELGLDLAGGSHLVFEADTESVDNQKKQSALEGVREVIERRVNLFGISEPSVTLSSFEGSDRIIVELPGVKDTSEAISLIGQTAQLVFAETGTEEEPGLFPTSLTGGELESAEVIFDSTNGKPGVGIEFNDEGAAMFSDLTQKNIGKPLAIVLDGAVISAPIVQGQITGGSAQITGDFTLDQAKNLSIQLTAGALPIPVKIIEQRTVGATLGVESVERSVQAGLIGLGMVMLFMVLAYGRFGMVANAALFIFGVITFSLYKLIPVVLTLPGIAGFLLSVGMAVDSNILIFERFKEEIRKRPFADALETAFGRAWDSIRDANIATLFTAFILANPLDWQFLHTSGPVRGFAITLALGILISLFTGVVVTRNLLRVFIRKSGRVKD